MSRSVLKSSAALFAFVAIPLVASSSAHGAAAVGLLNGNFAAPGTSGQLTVNTTLTGWTGGGKEGNFGSTTVPPVFVYQPGVYSVAGDAFMGTVGFYGFDASNAPAAGGAVVALDADSSWKGTISQSITGLTVGSAYTLSFNWANGQQLGFSGPTTNKVQATFGSTVLSTTIASTASQVFGGWKSASLTFTPTSTTQTLTLAAVGTPGGSQSWTLLNNVSLAVAPEPTSLAALGLGATLLRRRRTV